MATELGDLCLVCKVTWKHVQTLSNGKFQWKLSFKYLANLNCKTGSVEGVLAKIIKFVRTLGWHHQPPPLLSTMRRH